MMMVVLVGDGDDLWKNVVFGNSVGHDAHRWKLRDEDGRGKKKTRAVHLRQRRFFSLLLYLTKIGGLDPKQ